MSPENAAIYSKVAGFQADPPDDYTPVITGRDLDAMLDAARAEGEHRERGVRIELGRQDVGFIATSLAGRIGAASAAGLQLSAILNSNGQVLAFALVPIPAAPPPTPIEERIVSARESARRVGLTSRSEAIDLNDLERRVSVLEFESVEARMAAGKMSINDGRRRLGLVDGEEAAPATSEDEFATPVRTVYGEPIKGERVAPGNITADKLVPARPAPCDVCGKPGQFRAGMTFATCDEHGEPIVRGFAEKGIDPAGWKLVKDGPALAFGGGRRGFRPWERFYRGPWSVGPGAPRGAR